MGLTLLVLILAPAATPVRAQPPAAPAGSAAGSAAVTAALAALDDARAALRRSRLGVEGELLLRPEIDLLARDDPPRPLEVEVAWRPEASLAWAPLASAVLVDEARVLEAERAVIAARREEVEARLRSRVVAARAAAELWEARLAADAAEADEAAAADAVARARAGLAAAGAAMRAEVGAEAGADAERTLAEAERALLEARLDLREARLDLAAARREVDGPTGRAGGASRGGEARGGDARLGGRAGAPTTDPCATAATERPELLPPDLVPVRTLRTFRARERRLAAAVAVAERRRVDAFVPYLGIQAGYAGSAARTWVELELDGGRPRGRLAAALEGTPQERGWATLSLTLRLGDDGPAAATAAVAAREAARRALASLAADLEAEVADALAASEAAQARWRLAEARLAAACGGDDAGGVPTARDAARRDWLRFLGAAVDAAEVLEAPLRPR